MNFFVKKKKQMCRFGSHISWFIILLLTIAAFVLAATMGAGSILARDSVSILHYIFGTENLNGKRLMVDDKEAAEAINICLNYGGNIANELFGIQSSEAEFLSRFYQISLELNNIQTSSNSSVTIPEIKTEIDGFKQNFTSIIKNANDNNSPIAISKKMEGWTDSSIFGYQKSCTGDLSKDIWVQSDKLCQDSFYPYRKVTEASTLGLQSCLVLSEWSTDQIKSRYSDITNCTGIDKDFTNVSDAAIAYYNALNNIEKDNNVLTEKIIAELKIINGKFETAGTGAEAIFKDIKTYSSKIYKELYKAVGSDKNIYDIVNCGYLVGDVNIIYANLLDVVSPKCLSLAITLMIVALFSFIAVVFDMMVIFKNIEKKRRYGALTLKEEDLEALEKEGMDDEKQVNSVA